MISTEKILNSEKFRSFNSEENGTWRVLYNNLESNRKELAYPLFNECLQKLEIGPDSIPDLDQVNKTLEKLTGWKGVPVTGLEDGYSFYPALARREFPIGNFIRDKQSLGYTPAPDIFHDLYGHIPYYSNLAYANFCCDYGRLVSKYLDFPEKLKMFERFFWFTVEFGLVKTQVGQRIFGAGILSSFSESIYSLSNEPEVLPFNLRAICLQDYRIDQIQPRLFVLQSPEELYDSLRELEYTVNQLC